MHRTQSSLSFFGTSTPELVSKPLLIISGFVNGIIDGQNTSRMSLKLQNLYQVHEPNTDRTKQKLCSQTGQYFVSSHKGFLDSLMRQRPGVTNAVPFRGTDIHMQRRHDLD
jgi:hypothetical protein